MNKGKKENMLSILAQTFDMLALIPVSGDNVESMCKIRDNLRMAYALIDREKEETDG